MAEQQKAILVGKALTKQFKGLIANYQVDFTLNQGEILGLIGPNGAGKTTLVNMISGSLAITSGDVLFKGKSIKGLKPYQIGRLGIARTYQIVKPFARMTVLENIAVGAMFGRQTKKQRIRRALDMAGQIVSFVGLEKVRNQQADQLSVASRKRLEIAKALAMNPEVVLFDEVMSGLNSKEIDAAVALIHQIRAKGISIIVIEHVMRAIKAISDRLFVLHHGEKIAEGPPLDVLNNKEVIQAYLGKRYQQAVIS
ncbi:MAG: ABC transporter ATP-binding protein [Desulfobacterales bacterium]